MLLVAAGLLAGPSAQAGPNDGGVLVVHATSQLYTSDTQSYMGLSGVACGQDGPPAPMQACPPYDPIGGADPCINTAANPTSPVAAGVPHVWYVMAAFPDPGCPRLKAVSFRIDFDPTKMALEAWGTDPETFEITFPSDLDEAPFPAAGSGTGLVLYPTTTSLLQELYWFAGYAYEGESDVTFALREKESFDDVFVDDSIPTNMDLIRGFGILGLGGTIGSNPTPGGPAITGACCAWWGGCYATDVVHCADENGAWQGLGTVCEPNPCPNAPLEGACCFENGECHVMNTVECPGLGGVFQGAGVSCTPDPCGPAVAGACCLADGTCLVLTPSECAAQQGSYQGTTTCEPNPCPPPTPTERKSWGQVKVRFR
jgi:hypothetical protein